VKSLDGFSSASSRQKNDEPDGRIPRHYGFEDEIEAFCRRWKINELAVFGSILRDDFRRESDVDVLVTFAPDVSWRFDDMLEMRQQLQQVFGRPVDVVEKRLVDSSANYIRRQRILENSRAIYWRDDACCQSLLDL
jgi:predicted nucleotidyltransferase